MYRLNFIDSRQLKCEEERPVQAVSVMVSGDLYRPRGLSLRILQILCALFMICIISFDSAPWSLVTVMPYVGLPDAVFTQLEKLSRRIDEVFVLIPSVYSRSRSPNDLIPCSGHNLQTPFDGGSFAR